MKRFPFYLVAVIVVINFFNSCDKSKQYCAFVAPQMVYVGFDESERDTIVIRRFTKRGGFSVKPLDTFLVSKANIHNTIIGQDSIILSPLNYTQLRDYFYGNDWLVVLPGAKHIDTFSNIEPRFTTQTEASTVCQSFAKAMIANGKVVTYSQWLTDTYKYYINK